MSNYVCGQCGCSATETVRLTDMLTGEVLQYIRCWECKEKLTDTVVIERENASEEDIL